MGKEQKQGHGQEQRVPQAPQVQDQPGRERRVKDPTKGLIDPEGKGDWREVDAGEGYPREGR